MIPILADSLAQASSDSYLIEKTHEEFLDYFLPFIYPTMYVVLCQYFVLANLPK